VELKPVPFDSALERYQKQAEELLAAHAAGDSQALQIFHHKHPRFLDLKIAWLPKNLSESDIRSAELDVADAQLTVARWYDFQDWQKLAEYVAGVAGDRSILQFEAAVEAVIAGDLAALEVLLRENPELIRARSTRVHRATLLHYVGANGVEGHRQKTPQNAVAIAKCLLQAGAEVDALADLYGGQCTTMTLLVSSCHPAEAGVQVALTETLLDFGAGIEGAGSGQWGSPLMTALAFGYLETAQALARRGARVDSLVAAAGLGRVADAERLLAAPDPESRHRALALSAQHGHVEIVRLLLDAGEDPNRYNPDGMHSHSTPLHQAVIGSQEGVVRLLVERGARLDIKDTIYQSTPLGWAEYGGKLEIEKYLRSKGAPD
jgi:hypothetical protein